MNKLKSLVIILLLVLICPFVWIVINYCEKRINSEVNSTLININNINTDNFSIENCFTYKEKDNNTLVCYIKYHTIINRTNIFNEVKNEDKVQLKDYHLNYKSSDNIMHSKRYSDHNGYKSKCGFDLYFGETCALVFDNVPTDLSNHVIEYTHCVDNNKFKKCTIAELI